MIFAIDVDYRNNHTAVAAGILFQNWNDEKPSQILTVTLYQVEDYISGQFYKRELPCILELLKQLDKLPKFIIVDGYVFLGKDKKGLGAYLYEALKQKVPIIGVAKNPFQDISNDTYIYRGKSKKPLYITSTGIELNKAKQYIKSMHGEYRIPTLLKEVDTICRTR